MTATEREALDRDTEPGSGVRVEVPLGPVWRFLQSVVARVTWRRRKRVA